MKNIFIILCIGLCSCSVREQPKVYSDLYLEKIAKTGSPLSAMFYSEHRTFWLYAFKSIATNAFIKQSMKVPTIGYGDKVFHSTNLKVESQYITQRFSQIADSIGTAAAQQGSSFHHYLYFNSSRYLDNLSNHYYRSFKHDSVLKAIEKGARKARKEETEH